MLECLHRNGILVESLLNSQDNTGKTPMHVVCYNYQSARNNGTALNEYSDVIALFRLYTVNFELLDKSNKSCRMLMSM